MVDLEDLGIDEDAKMKMEKAAEEVGMDISELQIPKNKLEKLAETFSEEEFERAMRQAFKQIKN